MSASGGGAGQIDIMLSMTTPLGADVLRPTHLRATESISAPFVFTVTMVSTEQSIDADSLLYQPVCVLVHRPPATDRYFHGIVRRFAAAGLPARGNWTYEAEIVPKLWFMGQTADCRIFQNVAIADILTTLFSENGITDTSIKIYGSKPTQDYVTQYNETDLDFATRLMEQAGYYYFFQHTAGAHTLVLTDRNQAFTALALPSHQVVHEGGNAEVFNTWRKLSATAVGAVTLLDYDCENPTTLPKGNTTTTLKTAGASLRDVFRWPALTVQAQDATNRSTLRIQAAEAAAALYEGAGADQALVPGSKFTILRDPFTGAQGTEYVVHSVSHAASDETWITGRGEPTYANSFAAFPSATPWRQPMAMPRPVMAGIHAAIVLGNSGEEIHSEGLARVKIRFFWDHRSDATANTVCWVRILQPWSGNTWGWQHLPRVGAEVGVAFMDGDPDRPVMVGAFYNADMMPVFAVPAQQTKSGLRTRSTTSGSTTTFSELSFDDTKGSELVFFHAEKDMFTEIENNQTLTVGNDRMVSVKQNETTEIGNNQTLTVDATRTATIKQDETITIDGSQTETITQDRTTKITQGNDTLTINTGNLTVKTSLGTVSYTAMQSITLQVGQNSITIDQTGVTISGLMITLKGQVQVQIQAPIIQVAGDGMLMLTGGVMMLN